MHLVVGLGNPGARYRRTRHNAGFMVVDALAERWGARCERRQFGALVDTVRMGAADAVLAKPQSFMNRSGAPTSSLRGFYKTDPAELVVIHDDLDLAFGTVRLKAGGGHGGHNGLRNIQATLGRNDFIRVRVGVSRPPEGWDAASYVLSAWTPAEDEDLASVVGRAADAVEAVLQHGIRAAMNEVNTRGDRRNRSKSTDAEPAASRDTARPSIDVSGE